MDKELKFKQFDLSQSISSDVEFEYIDMQDFFKECLIEPYLGHTHSYYQILWFQKGEGVHYVDFKEYPIKDNTLFFISPGQIHYFERNTHFEGVMIHFNESFLSDDQSSENVFLKYNLFNAFDAVPYYTITADSALRLHYISNEIKTELGNVGAFAYHDYLQYLIKMFLIYIQRNAQRGVGMPLCINNAANRTFVRFRQLLEEHYKKCHTVKEYANFLHVSTKTLTNSVIESTQSTPLKLINARITLEAKRQLLYSSLKVKEISYLLGFEDPSYFVKFFKRVTGALPAEWRK